MATTGSFAAFSPAPAAPAMQKTTAATAMILLNIVAASRVGEM
jgi:hypothetical protein